MYVAEMFPSLAGSNSLFVTSLFLKEVKKCISVYGI